MVAQTRWKAVEVMICLFWLFLKVKGLPINEMCPWWLQGFGLNSWMTAVAINWNRENAGWRSFGRGYQEFNFGLVKFKIYIYINPFPMCLLRTCYHGSYKKVFLEELNCLNKVEHWVLGLAMWPSLIADMTRAISMEGCKPYWRELKRKRGIVEYSNYRIFASSDVSAKENEEMEKLQEWKQRKLS